METMNAIIQARMGSSRLPGKILMKLEGTPILEHIVRRLNQVKNINTIIVATSDKATDDEVEKFCMSIGVPCVRGSEENVLQRFGKVSELFPADIYIRATSDNPMIDINLISNMISYFKNKQLTYTCYKNYPIGSGVEIFSNHSLKEALNNANKDYEFEHVTPYMYQTMRDRKVEYYTSEKDDSGIRMTIDTQNDLRFAQEVFKRLYPDNQFFGIEDIKTLLAIEPDLIKINKDIHQKKLGE